MTLAANRDDDPEAAGGDAGDEAPAVKAEASPANDGDGDEEVQGVFVVRDGKAVFVPVETGIAGEKYFEVLSGLEQGDEVVTGNFSALRKLKNGDAVKQEKKKDAKEA